MLRANYKATGGKHSRVNITYLVHRREPAAASEKTTDGKLKNGRNTHTSGKYERITYQHMRHSVYFLIENHNVRIHTFEESAETKRAFVFLAGTHHGRVRGESNPQQAKEKSKIITKLFLHGGFKQQQERETVRTSEIMISLPPGRQFFG